MKRILGLDLGTTSIGWALVSEAETPQEQSSIVQLGVRVNPLTVDEQQNFEKGKPITTNADRTLKRSMRRNLQRYKLRRAELQKVLRQAGIIKESTILTETNKVIFDTYRLRAKAAREEITLEQLARVLFMINKKRGYKSSRKLKSDDEGAAIDGMDVARQLYEESLTPGQYVLRQLEQGKCRIPDFYPSDLQAEFDAVWACQQQFYPEQLTEELKSEVRHKTEKQTWAILAKVFDLKGEKIKGRSQDEKLMLYRWRVKALQQQMDAESLAVVFQKINGQISGSSGFLGGISDRSKELYFHKQTVGEYLMARLAANPNNSLKNLVFYRQDYLDEFEQIWETQARFHPELTPELKHEIRDVVIFYQRALRSQKGLINLCEFEQRTISVEQDGSTKQKTVGLRVCPKSSPLFQEFKIWQVLANLRVTLPASSTTVLSSMPLSAHTTCRPLSQQEKESLFAELNIRGKLSKKEVLKTLFGKSAKDMDLNYKEVEGNRTQAALYAAYLQILEMSGHNNFDFSKLSAQQIADGVKKVFFELGFGTAFLHFDATLPGKQLEKQAAYRLWHLLYSFAGDNTPSGTDRLVEGIQQLTGFPSEYARVLSRVVFEPDYGSLSAKAIRSILPHMKAGMDYSDACQAAGYRHSQRSLTREELAAKELKDHLELLPRNSLRNPVVEKILNQMINVVNGVMQTHGRLDEIRIELARDLKNSADERACQTQNIQQAAKEHERITKVLQQEFGITHPSRNDIIRFKLYEELAANDYKTLYSNTYIPREKIFSKEFDIEHIIPQAKLFDDSFANKTLEARDVNIEKSNATAMDYVERKYGPAERDAYVRRVEDLSKAGRISKGKQNRLLMREEDIPSDFIERDLRNSQYIARKAREILEQVVRHVVPTVGAITARLRSDWQLVDVMKELNMDKYRKQGLTYTYQDRDGRTIHKIKDWTKRNDHRHHAMDALVIAFTSRSIVQYYNNMNARSDKSSSIYGIEQKQMERVDGKLLFRFPIPRDEFRRQAREHLERILVSIKSKGKVTTRNVNRTKGKNGTRNERVQLTPRGQLHNETVYGKIQQYETFTEKVGSSFTAEKIALVANRRIREALMARLQQFHFDPKKAFTGKNSLQNQPIFLNSAHTQVVPERVKLVRLSEVFTGREAVSPDLKLEKVIDPRVRAVLQERLDACGGNAKEAFSNLDENPIWLNRDKGISIKRVTVRSNYNCMPLHDKRDHLGRLMLDSQGRPMPTDYVNTSNNHHVAIFLDSQGELQEHIVSFFEATERARQGLPVVDRHYRQAEGWQFLFSMRQNEYFVFPHPEEGFNPNEVDLLDPRQYHLISPHLYRVQKLSSKDYYFRHHLETMVADVKELKEVTWKRIQSLKKLMGLVKVRVNHVGRIVAVGEE